MLRVAVPVVVLHAVVEAREGPPDQSQLQRAALHLAVQRALRERRVDAWVETGVDVQRLEVLVLLATAPVGEPAEPRQRVETVAAVDAESQELVVGRQVDLREPERIGGGAGILGILKHDAVVAALEFRQVQFERVLQATRRVFRARRHQLGLVIDRRRKHRGAGESLVAAQYLLAVLVLVLDIDAERPVVREVLAGVQADCLARARDVLAVVEAAVARAGAGHEARGQQQRVPAARIDQPGLAVFDALQPVAVETDGEVALRLVAGREQARRARAQFHPPGARGLGVALAPAQSADGEGAVVLECVVDVARVLAELAVAVLGVADADLHVVVVGGPGHGRRFVLEAVLVLGARRAGGQCRRSQREGGAECLACGIHLRVSCCVCQAGVSAGK